jgi:PAS domain S-box-containing protein
VSDTQKRARILICEDEVLIAKDLESRLKNLGFIVCSNTTSGEQALELVEQHQPDLVIMDIVLQGEMDGIEVAEVIRDKWGIPVVFLTAYADTDKLERAKLAYPFGYLLKPFHDSDLKITTDMALYVSKVDAERREAEKSLEKAHTDLRLAQRIAKIGHWSLDPVVGRPEWSDHVYEIYERSPDDGPPSLEDYKKIYSAEHLDTFWTAIQAAIKNGKPYDIELLLNLPNGKSKWVHAICEPSPIKGLKGHVLKGTIQEITEYKLADQFLKESEEKYRLLIEATNDYIYSAVIFADYSSSLEWVDGSFTEMTGYTVNDVNEMPKGWLSVIHPEDAMKISKEKFLSDRIEEGKWKSEYRITTKQGDIRWLQDRIIKLEVQGDETIHWVGGVRDITDQKKAEEALRKSEERYRLVVDNANESIIILQNGEIQFFNKKSLELTGYSAEEYKGKTIAELVHPDDADVLIERHKRRLMGEIKDEPYEYRIITKEGETRWVRMNPTQVMWGGNRQVSV